jgi:hypothetical protein
MMMMILLLSVTTTITSIAHLFTTYSIAYSANPSQSKQQPPSCNNPIGRVLQYQTGFGSSCDSFPDSQGCFEYSTNPYFDQTFHFTAPVNGTAICTSLTTAPTTAPVGPTLSKKLLWVHYAVLPEMLKSSFLVA